MTRLPSLITVFPVNVLLPVRTQLPLSFLASVVTPVPASPIVPASVLLPVLVPPSAMVRAWFLLARVTGPVSVKTIAPVPEASMKLVPAARVNRADEHTSELQSLMRTSYPVFCVTNTTQTTQAHK